MLKEQKGKLSKYAIMAGQSIEYQLAFQFPSSNHMNSCIIKDCKEANF